MLVGKVFRPHRLTPLAQTQPFRLQLEHVQAGLLGVSHLRYGSTVQISPGAMERFYLLQVPLAGRADIRSGSEQFVTQPGVASLLSPQPDVDMCWHAGNEQLILRIEANILERFLTAWCGEEPGRLPIFKPMLDMAQQPLLASLLEQLVRCTDSIQRASAGTDATLSTLQLQYQILANLLTGQAHDMQALLTSPCPPLAPRSVRRVEEYLEHHCDQPLSPEILAQVAGVSVRSLFLGFEKTRGTTPMRLLRQLRMQRARQELLQPKPGLRITDVALRWGFGHLGRFSQEYEQAFGETPRATLRSITR